MYRLRGSSGSCAGTFHVASVEQWLLAVWAGRARAMSLQWLVPAPPWSYPLCCYAVRACNRLTPALPLQVARGAIGGFLVGLGAAIGNGCTSGHGICGNARLSPRSMVYT